MVTSPVFIEVMVVPNDSAAMNPTAAGSRERPSSNVVIVSAEGSSATGRESGGKEASA